ncbi:MAG TPA: cellulase family glycosylhydrolase [Bradyrhizobium sp.]|nr:cellulase family glycosylhydrolase [Bradyrhizobium sp.]
MTARDTKPVKPLLARGNAKHGARTAPTTRITAMALAVGFILVGMAGEGRAQSVPATAITVGTVPNQATRVLRDGYGRQITLRGFNVSASSKLVESALLPFHSTGDAALSAQAMRDQTGANVVRFLITWEGVEPSAPSIDYNYLAQVAQQIEAFTDRGFYVFLDYHQDLYSQHIFNANSWYTGDGAPAWVITAGSYPTESCGICLLWGQNMLTNTAVRSAIYDFWHNREISTSSGLMYLQSAYLAQATETMTYLRQHLSADAFTKILGVDPFNEPFDGGLDGAAGTTWEQNYLMPFYVRFRSAMDAAGWTDKLALIEPLVFWNSWGATPEGGLSTVGTLGSRYVFNAHYYDGARLSIDPFAAGDGSYSDPMNTIRGRATTLATAGFVSETGFSMGDSRTPWIIRALYEGLDHGGNASDWWAAPGARGSVLSSTLWHWDIYSGRHHELMNGNPSKVEVSGDGWNGEDYSIVKTDASGNVVTRLDPHLLDRIFPAAVAGDILAFAMEDLASSGFAGSAAGAAWLTVPSSLPNLNALTQGRRFGVLVWRETAAAASAPTELHLPASFVAASTVVISDLGTAAGLTTTGAIAVTAETGSTVAQKLLLTTPGTAPGAVHVALVVDRAGATPAPNQFAAAASELVNWQRTLLP